MKLSIIIVNYNTYKLTKQTIDCAIYSKPSFDYEILLIDNASSDGSIEALQKDFQEESYYSCVKVIRNKENLGFAKANNQGIREAKGDYILLLNSDTALIENCLEGCMQRMSRDSQIGALGCKVVLENGQLDEACKRGFPTPLASLYYFLKWDKKNPEKYGQYHALMLDENQEGEVDALTGAFMLMPRKVLEQVGFLDETFFMYGEDIDLCYRIKQAGYKILYYPAEKIIHYKGGSSYKKRHKVIYDFHQAMWIFYKKHYQIVYGRTISLCVGLGIGVKFLLALVKNLLKPKKPVVLKELYSKALQKNDQAS